MLANKVKSFFNEVEAVWAAVPGYVKVFLYSAISSGFGLWVLGQLDLNTVIVIVASNLGLYQVPRTISKQTKKVW